MSSPHITGIVIFFFNSITRVNCKLFQLATAQPLLDLGTENFDFETDSVCGCWTVEKDFALLKRKANRFSRNESGQNQTLQKSTFPDSAAVSLCLLMLLVARYNGSLFVVHYFWPRKKKRFLSITYNRNWVSFLIKKENSKKFHAITIYFFNLNNFWSK